MKNIFTRACIVAALMVGAMAAAHAADLPNSLKATTLSGAQVVVTAERIASFECMAGQVNTVRVDSNPAYYVDNGGALCAKFQTLPNFVKQPGANRWFQVTYDTAQCYSGSTLMVYTANLPLINDGCQLHSLLQAKSK